MDLFALATVPAGPDEAGEPPPTNFYMLRDNLGSARQVVMDLASEEQMLPRRTVGQRHIRWARASYGAVHKFLTNPAYAGAFVFGRKRREKRMGEDGRIRVRDVEVPIGEWSVCLPGHHPGYASWDEYLATRERLRANMTCQGQGGGVAREGHALLQGLVRCGRCGRRMQIAYAGKGGRSHRYACVRGRDLHATGKTCQSLGGKRLERAVVALFSTRSRRPGSRRPPGAIHELAQQHEQRLAGQRLALERAEFEAERAERQFDACEPENRLVARTLEGKLEQALAAAERERGELAATRAARVPHRSQTKSVSALTRLAHDLPRLWDAKSTSDRDRKELLRTLINEIVLTVHTSERRAALEICWEGGARTELQVQLSANVFERQRTSEDTIELIPCRLAEHYPDRQIAQTLSRQGRLTASGLPFTQARVQSVRVKAGIPAAPPPNPASQLFTILQAAGELGVSTNTIHRWLRQGLLPGEQTTPGAPWRIRLNDEIRARFQPDVPDGYVPLNQAAQLLGCARQTVLHKVQRGELRAVQVTQGRRKGLRIEVPDAQLDRMINQ